MHNSAKSYVVVVTKEMFELGWEVLPYPAWSLSDFHLFRSTARSNTCSEKLKKYKIGLIDYLKK